MSILRLEFLGFLPKLLSRMHRGPVVDYLIRRRANLKDIIESLGIPHTEIGRIFYDRRPLSFRYIPEKNMKLTVVPFDTSTLQSLPNELWPEFYDDYSFMVDVNVQKLVNKLRMVGFDSIVVLGKNTSEKAFAAREKQRVLLSRDRNLMKNKATLFGQLLRTENADDQLVEVLNRFGLADRINPFSRCIKCNSILKGAKKEEILSQLKPLTQKYYTEFKRCSGCEEIYWKGSHHKKMVSTLNGLGVSQTNFKEIP